MLQYEFKGNKTDMRITKPIKGLLFENIMHTATVRVSLVNSATGQETQLIPRTGVQKLMAYGSWGEGYYTAQHIATAGHDVLLFGYVPLSDTVVGLSNDMYISVDVLDNTGGQFPTGPDVKLYGFEDKYIASQYIYNMQRMFLAAGELEKSFGVTAAEFLVLPLRKMNGDGSLSDLNLNSIQLYTTSGMSPIMTFQELIHRAHQENDIEYELEGGATNSLRQHTVCVIDLEGVTRIDVRLNGNTVGYDFNLVDIRDSNLPQASLSVETIQRAMIPEVIPVQASGAITT